MAASSKRTFSKSDFKHHRGSPAGVIYHGTVPLHLKGRTPIQPGERLSRRQYENLRYEAGGWKSKSEYERIVRAPGKRSLKDGDRKVHEVEAYDTWARIYSEEHGTSIKSTKGPESEYNKAFIKAYRNKFKDTSPNSPFAQLLQIVGLREDEDSWDVGDTPSSK